METHFVGSDELLSVNEAADVVGVTRQTIYNWIRKGHLACKKTAGGRYRIPAGQLFREPGAPVARESGVEKPDAYPVIDISGWMQLGIEEMGTKAKAWYAPPDDPDARYLFKEGRPATGENWSEMVAAELCELLGVPHAVYGLAKQGDRQGVLTRHFVPGNGELVHGNELLVEADAGYRQALVYHQREHTLSRVLSIVRDKIGNPPPGWDGDGDLRTALDVFVGYLMLDAWIANTDRHHENWAMIRLADGTRHLAPSYDHASSLGRNETDERRMKRLATKDARQGMKWFVERARSAFFATEADRKPMTTLKAFKEAAEVEPAAARGWLERLRVVDFADVRRVFERLPSGWISGPAIDFALKMLELNRNRLLAYREAP